MRLNDFRRKFKKFGVTVTNKKTPGSHNLKLEKVIDGRTYMFPVSVKGKHVHDVYVKKARRRFKLLPEDGVSNDDFRKA